MWDFPHNLLRHRGFREENALIKEDRRLRVFREMSIVLMDCDVAQEIRYPGSLGEGRSGP